MEIPIAGWDYVLGHYNQKVPIATFTPSLEMLELAKQNHNHVWVTVANTGFAGLDGQSFDAVIDKSMNTNPYAYDLSKNPSIYTATLRSAPYKDNLRPGKFFINKTISVMPPVVAYPNPITEQYTYPSVSSPQQGAPGLDMTSLALVVAAVASAFVIIIVSNSYRIEESAVKGTS